MGRRRILSRLERDRCEDFFDRKFCSVAAIAGVATVAGAAISADAAGSAAEGQQQAAQQSNALQYQMFRENQALQAPTINAGNTARDRLMYRLGLSPTGTSGAPPKTYDQLRTQLLGQFTRQVPGAGTSQNLSPLNQGNFDRFARGGADATGQNAFRDALLQDQGGAIGYSTYGQRGQGGADSYGETPVYGYGPQSSSSIDEAGLDAEIKRMLAEQDASAAAMRARAESDPMYGDLEDKYVAGVYTPDTFKFGRDDFQEDPGYQFRLEQGQKALDRKAAAGGRFFSGSALTGASNYAGQAASDEFGNAFSRAMNTFGTNEGNRRGAFALNEGNRFGAYQANFNNAVNPLLSLAGAATLGSQNLGSAGANMASTVGANITGAANTSGAAGIASANAIGNGITGAVGGYQNNRLMQDMLEEQRLRRTGGAGGVNNNPGMNLWSDGGFFSGNRGSGD